MQSILILLSSILVFITYLIYEWGIVVGKTKPHRTTRLVLLIITAIGAASLIASQDRVAVWFIGICALQSVVVFLLSLKYGVGGWAKTDLICLGIAIIGIVIWKVTNNPALGLYASIIADFSGMIPALIKTYRRPDSEYYLSYIFDIVAAVLTLLAITSWKVEGFAYPLYIAIINSVMLFLIIRPEKK